LSFSVVERAYPFAEGGMYELIAGKDPQDWGRVLFLVALTEEDLKLVESRD